jgi:hypothetical protein
MEIDGYIIPRRLQNIIDKAVADDSLEAAETEALKKYIEDTIVYYPGGILTVEQLGSTHDAWFRLLENNVSEERIVNFLEERPFIKNHAEFFSSLFKHFDPAELISIFEAGIYLL